MYSVDERDSVVRLPGMPQSSIGAPLPVVVSDESWTLVSYCVETHDPDWDGTTCREVGPDSAHEEIAIVRFVWPHALMFGPPNDEAFEGHPLASRGLGPYGTFEILDSSWIRKLERMNSVHRRHNPQRFTERRHFVLSFHDTTLECVAQGVELVKQFRGSMRIATSEMVKLLAVPRPRSL